MNINNIKRFSFILLATWFFVGCEDQLDLSPVSAIGENAFYTNTDEVEGGVLAIYDGLQAVPLREFALTEMRSDNTRTKSSEGDWAQFESFNVEPTNLAIGDYWTANYNVIFRANKVLEYLSVVENATLRSQFEGEAKFARALAHFNLVRAYGNVPMIDQVVFQTDTDFFSSDPVSEVLAFIDADLKTAMETLPSKSEMDFGRATSGAATALLAKVRLTKGEHGSAATLLSGIISGSEYSLMGDYNSVFFSEGNDEIIFAIPYVDDDANESQDYSFEMTAGGVVSGLNYITDNFFNSVDPADTRVATLYNPANSAEVGKFVTVSSDARLCGNDWVVLRLADVHLMYAEALMAGGNSTMDTDAIGAYNSTRSRASLPTLATDGTATLTKEMLLEERRIELAFENHRFYDLVRFGEANSILGAFAVEEGWVGYSGTDLILPIPQGEINVSQGLLLQNPGY